MDTIVGSAKIKTQQKGTEEQRLYSVEEVFDHIDDKFIRFYGEYGRKIVGARRSEWNQEDIVKASLVL